MNYVPNVVYFWFDGWLIVKFCTQITHSLKKITIRIRISIQKRFYTRETISVIRISPLDEIPLFFNDWLGLLN